MPKIEVLQRWAERYAKKLGIAEGVKVVPMKECPEPGKRRTKRDAHIHIEGACRGTICWWGIHPNSPAHLRGGWKWVMAHEVCHLAVVSHHSPYFIRRMALLGFSVEREEARAVGMLREKKAGLDIAGLDAAIAEVKAAQGR